jgi:predicted lipoprotein with Yx(FWY)xxD motif
MERTSLAEHKHDSYKSNNISHSWQLIIKYLIMNRLRIIIFITLLYSISTFIFVGCGKDSVSTISTKYKVQLATSSTLGSHLVDSSGCSLYYFADDCKGLTTCLNGCKEYWPYFYASSLSASNLGAGLSLSDFDTIMVNDSTPQTRYKGWPLYYYCPSTDGVFSREAAGKTTGEAIGGIWFVAKPDYSIMLAEGQLIGNDGNNYVVNSDTIVRGTGKSIYFVDSLGVTLYIYTQDSFKVIKYTGSDFSLYKTKRIVVPSTLTKSYFTYKTDTSTKKSQLFYKGWPLYKFGSDNDIMGNNKGVNVSGPWFVGFKALSSAP